MHFFNWGNNCKLLKMTIQQCMDTLYAQNSTVTTAQHDEFFEGYTNGTNTELVSLPVGVGYSLQEQFSVDGPCINTGEASEETLENVGKIADGSYDLERPSSQIIPELVAIIAMLLTRVNDLESEST